MIDPRTWFGQDDDDEDDPVKKTLRYLGMGVDTATQAASDIGTGISTAASSAGEALGSGLSFAAQTAASYLPAPFDPATLSPEDRATEDEVERRRGIVRAGAQAAPAAAITAAQEAYQDPLTSSLPAVPRAGRIISEAGSAAGRPFVRGVGTAVGGTEPVFTTPEVETPLGTIPSVSPTPGDIGAAVGSVVGDPTSWVLPGSAGDKAADLAIRNLAGPAVRAAAAPVRAAGRVVGEAAEGLGAALGRNAENVAAADARMAADGVTLPGTLGVITDNPLEASRAVGGRIIPPEVADTLDYPLRIPDDPALIRAIEAQGGTVDERGTTMHLIRNQGPEAAGGTATRGMTYHIAGEPGARNPYATNAEGSSTGGSVRVEGPTRYRNPLVISEGGGKGYLDNALEQLGVQAPPDPANVTRWEQGVETLRAAVADARQSGDRYAIQANEDDLRVAERMLEKVQQPKPVAGRREIDEQVNELRRRTRPDTPERTAGLQEIVTRYGGDPAVVPDLVKLRPDETESGYAIIENIVGAHARRAGHDGVWYVRQGIADAADVSAHPSVAAADTALQQANAAENAAIASADRLRDAGKRRGHPEYDAAWQRYEHATQRTREAMRRLDDAERQARAELAPRHIEEVADPREQLNPTPGAPGARIQSAEARAALAAQERAANRYATAKEAYYAVADQEGYGSAAARSAENRMIAAGEDMDRLARESEAVGAATATVGPPSPPGYTLREDIPRRAVAPEEAARSRRRDLEHEIEQWTRAAASAHQRYGGASTETRAAWQRVDDLEAKLAALQQADSTTATATAGTLLATPGAGALSAVNRALGEGIAGGVGGAVIEQGRNPDEDPRTAAARGFAVGAVGFPAATRLARGAARLAGAGADVGGGARIALGDVPPSQIRTPGLPGFEEAPPPELSRLAERMLGPAGETAAMSSARAAGGQTYLPTAAPGQIDRLVRGLDPLWNRLGIVRYAGMLSDTAGHAQNAVGNLSAALADIAETPLMVAQDVARVGAMKAVGKEASREVFMSEMPARVRGMVAGAKAGLPQALEIMKTGIDPAEAAKLDQGPRGFGTNVPGLAPAGSTRAKAVDAAVELPLRALGAADAIFRGAAANGHLAAEALAEATRRNGGKKPSADQIHLAMSSKPVRDRADELAARSVLQEDRAVTNWYRDAVIGKAPGAAKLIIQTAVPWVRTPYNIMAQGLGMTDIGALAGVIQDVRAGRAPRQVQRRVARAAIGTAIGAWAAGEYADGDITGPYPTDAAERSTLPPGWRAWSKKVEAPNGETYYLPLAALGPFAVPAVYQILRAEAIKKGADPMSKELLGDVAMGIGRFAEQNTFLEGLGTVSKLFDPRTGEANVGKLVEDTVAQYAPHVLGFGGFGREMQRIMGMPSRDPEGWLEAIAATNPLTAGSVRPRQDVLGREQSLGIGGPAAAFIRGGREEDDPVIAAFRDAGQALPTAGPKKLTDPGTKQEVELDPDQRAEWERAYGDALQQHWANSGFSPDPTSLARVKSRAGEDARRRVLGR